MAANLCSVKILVGLLFNLTWLEVGRICDMDRERAEQLSKTKPRPQDIEGDGPVPASFVEILGEPTAAEIVPAPSQSGPQSIIRETPLEPATLEQKVENQTPVDALAGCPAADKLAAMAVTTLETLRALVTAHGDGFAKVLKLDKTESKAVTEWIAAQPAV